MLSQRVLLPSQVCFFYFFRPLNICFLNVFENTEFMFSMNNPFFPWNGWGFPHKSATEWNNCQLSSLALNFLVSSCMCKWVTLLYQLLHMCDNWRSDWSIPSKERVHWQACLGLMSGRNENLSCSCYMKQNSTRSTVYYLTNLWGIRSSLNRVQARTWRNSTTIEEEIQATKRFRQRDHLDTKDAKIVQALGLCKVLHHKDLQSPSPLGTCKASVRKGCPHTTQPTKKEVKWLPRRCLWS